MVTIRSPGGAAERSADSSVVFPVPVPGEEEVRPVAHESAEPSLLPGVEGSAFRQGVEVSHVYAGNPDRDGGALRRDRGQCGMHAHPGTEPHIDARRLVIEMAAAEGHEGDGEVTDFALSGAPGRHALRAASRSTNSVSAPFTNRSVTSSSRKAASGANAGSFRAPPAGRAPDPWALRAAGG